MMQPSNAAGWLGAIVGVVMALVFGGGGTAQGQELAEKVDRLVDQRAQAEGWGTAPAVDDAGFAKRVFLDFAGRTPTLEETQKFLDDTAADKRAKLVDQLLDRPEYAKRMRDLFHVMLMERRGDNAEWLAFLEQAFAENKPWDAVVREVLRPNAENEATRGAAFFHTRRLEKVGQQDTDYPGLTRDIGRLFMGVDLQCAQCHDHLFIDEYKQVDFQGLFTVVSNAYIRRNATFPALDEKPLTAKIEFASVFEGVKRETGPRVPFGAELPLPPPPAKGETGASSLALIAASLPTAENPRFARNMVNRLWFVLMGRGLVHPLDLHHGGNPPSHADVLELLAGEFTRQGFNVKGMLRELALTDVYARSSRLPEGAGKTPPVESFTVGLERRLSAEQLLAGVLTATGDPADGKDPARFKTLYDKHLPKFLSAFANPPKDPEDAYNATVQAALFTLNDGLLPEMLAPAGENLTARLARRSDDGWVDELFLSVLVRRPSAEERADFTAFVDRFGPDRRGDALRHATWALVSSMEFSVNP